MAIIKIQRKSEYNNRARNYRIFIDGQKAGTIADGETKEFAISGGQHTVTAKIDWCSSPDITLNADDSSIKILKVGGFKNGRLLMPVILGVVSLHFILQLAFGFTYLVYLLIPAFLYLVYHLTLGHGKYLVLEEI